MPLALLALLLAAPPAPASPAAPARPAVDAPGVSDPAAEAAWDAAVALRQQGRFADAARAFEALADAHPRSRRAPQALSAAGTLARWELGDTPRAEALWTRVLRGPDQLPGVDSALNELLTLERDRLGLDGELRLIHTLTTRRPRAEYTPRLLVRAATVLLDELDRPDPALSAARAAVTRAAGTTWWDDAALIEGRALVRLGRLDDAVAALRRITASHRDTLLGGDENSDLLDDAYLAVADALARDPARARDAERAYLRLVDEVAHSPFVDDALSYAARLAEARGDVDAARAHRARLLALRPDSRHLRAAPTAPRR